MKFPYKYFAFALLLILIDQAIKLWMHFDVLPNHYGEFHLIPRFFILHYTTNPGMAFGMELGGEFGKLILTTFRVAATFGISWYIIHLYRTNAHKGLLWALAAILGGALGNVIDSTFYGVYIAGNAIPNSPTPWFHGQVIDMFYAQFLDGYWPSWVPFLGGTYHYTPIFNFADASIFCGVLTILLFQRTFLENHLIDELAPEPQVNDTEENEILNNDDNEIK